MSQLGDLAPEGAIWVCLACGEKSKRRSKLLSNGFCRINVALCVDDKQAHIARLGHWRLYEPRG